MECAHVYGETVYGRAATMQRHESSSWGPEILTRYWKQADERPTRRMKDGRCGRMREGREKRMEAVALDAETK
jgi:hypothetical protein